MEHISWIANVDIPWSPELGKRDQGVECAGNAYKQLPLCSLPHVDEEIINIILLEKALVCC